MSVRLPSCLFIACLAVLPLFAQLPGQVTEYGRGFLKSVNSVRVAYMAATNDLPAKYEKDLVQLAEQFQKAGDLDGLLAVKSEQKRFKAAFEGERDPFEAVPEMPAEVFVAAPESLRALQEGYVRSFSQAGKARKEKLAELSKKFTEFLENIQKSLTRENRIEEAIAIRNHGEKMAAFLEKGDFAGLVEAYPSFGSLSSPEKASVTADRKSRVREARSGWRTWHHVANKPFSRDLPQLFDRDLPSDISVDYSSTTGRGRFTGISFNATRQIGSVLCSWFGNAVLWKVDSPDDLPVAIRTVSRKLTSNLDHGPHIQLAVFVNGKREKLLNVPVYAPKDVIRIVRDKKNPERFALYWPFGRQSETFELADDAKNIIVMLGVSLHDRGEACDVTFQCQDESL